MAWIYVISDAYPSVTGFTHLSAMQKNNVDIIYSLWHPYMTDEAIAGVLGNIDFEGNMNPGQGEYGHNMSPQYGLGLIQWTPNGHVGNNPLQVYATSQGRDWWDGDLQANWILSGEPGSWIPTTDYPYTWAEFCQLTDTALATRAYFEERERGTWSSVRTDYALDWYNYIHTTPPTPGMRRYGAAREMLRRLIIHA